MKIGALRAHAPDLGFTPQDQVRWLAPGQLVSTLGKVVLSSVFAGYTDRREVQAALPAPQIDVSSGGDGLWIDYLADLGDGFDSTYTVAWLLAQPTLEVDGRSLPRGDVLVFGGDEVYPTPSSTAYEDRTTGPYRAAFPADPTVPVHRRPTLLAIPGNHDWYDGLTAFLRVFTQRRSIGGWRTAQTRSYFAAKLNHGWWLVGIDTQFGTYIDEPQIRYFREHLSRRLEPGDAVIVCAATPAWVRTGLGDPDAFNSFHYFERELVEKVGDPGGGPSRPTGARVRVWLSGDLHHYSRYALASSPTDVARAGASGQLVTCGLGGAYLLGTADLPPAVELPPTGSRMSGRGASARFALAARWPSVEASRRLARGVFSVTGGLVARNPGLFALIGVVHAFALPVLAFLLGLEQDRTPGEVLSRSAPADVVGLGAQLGLSGLAVIALFVALPLLRGRRPQAPPSWIWAAGLQLIVALSVLAGMLAVPWPDWRGWQVVGMAGLLAFVVAGIAGSYALAVAIAGSGRREIRDWMFSAQAIEEGKGFLRMHLDPAGGLTLYPLLVERVCHDWELEQPTTPAGATVSRRRPIPVGGVGPALRLIEEPVLVSREPG